MEKVEEQAARDKAAIDAMKNARANMGVALDRISQLERALSTCADALAQAKGDISSKVYCYPVSGQQRSVHDRIDAQIAEARKVL